jgi:hypothetical protein
VEAGWAEDNHDFQKKGSGIFFATGVDIRRRHFRLGEVICPTVHGCVSRTRSHPKGAQFIRIALLGRLLIKRQLQARGFMRVGIIALELVLKVANAVSGGSSTPCTRL